MRHGARKAYASAGGATKAGRGLFAARLIERFPWLPIEEEGRLRDPRLREHFIERVFAFRRLRLVFGPRWRMRDLVAFHTAHTLTLMAHSEARYRVLGRLVAGAARRSRSTVEQAYSEGFMEALGEMATRRRHVHVLQHIAGHLTTHLDADSRAELRAVIEEYRRELVPIIVPLTLIRHYVRLHRVTYLSGQVYLEPHPKELMLGPARAGPNRLRTGTRSRSRSRRRSAVS